MDRPDRIRVAVVLLCTGVMMARVDAVHDGIVPQNRPVMSITRLYTGADNQTHAEDVNVVFDGRGVSKLLAISGAELHVGRSGSVSDWHPGPRRQYVITLSGRGELEVAGGKRIPIAPGHVELIEDTTGKGHITRVSTESDRVTLWLPIVEPPAR